MSTPTIFGREPVLIIGLVNTLLALAVGFGLDLSTEKQALIVAGVNAVLAFVARQQVSPTATTPPKEN